MKTFDEIAVEQGWNNDTIIGLLRQYIANQGDDAALDDFAQHHADEENAASDDPTTYGEVGWSVEDVQTLREDLTEDQAEDFLRRNEKHIRERTCELGWDILGALLDMDEQLPAKPREDTK